MRHMYRGSKAATVLFVLSALAVAGCTTLTGDTPDSGSPPGDSVARSPYVGQESRAIKALASEDITALEEGSGTALGGLAKPAELNSHPGPRHVLDVSEELELSESQVEAIQLVYDAMHAEAVRFGEELLDAEREIDEQFAAQTMTEQRLQDLLNESADAYADLRFAHLSAHLETIEILSPEQITAYDDLRGYSADDPCESVAEGHDPEMWRLHSECEKES